MQRGIEFYTATCLNWQNLLLTANHKQIILNSLEFLVYNKRIWLYGYVIMPNHVHFLWSKQVEWADKNVEQHFSKYTAQQLKFSLLADNCDISKYRSTQNDREYQFWERRPYKGTMYNRTVLEQKLEYIHYNPMKAGLCASPEDYEYSSIRYYLFNEPNHLLTHYMEHI